MALTADEWHILSICIFPLISILGIVASIFLSSANNRTFLAMGIMFSAGVLISGALVHMLPHATEVLDLHFATEDNHDDHGSSSSSANDLTDDHFGSVGGELADDDDHAGHDHRWLQQHDSHDDGEGEDSHAGHNHAFPWGQTLFSIAFLVLLMIEAMLERFIDVYFSGKKGNFFHHNEEEEIMYAEGFAAEHAKREQERLEKQEQCKSLSQAGTEAERAELASNHQGARVPKEEAPEAHKEDLQQPAAPPGPESAIKIPFPDCEDCQESKRLPVPDCIDCKMLTHQDLGYGDADKEIKHKHHHHHHHHHSRTHDHDGDDDDEKTEKDSAAGLVNRRASGKSNKSNEISDMGTRSAQQLPAGMFVGSQGGRARRRHSGASTRSGKSGRSNGSRMSSVWAKTAGRPSVVSFAVAPPQEEELDQQQTINPWVSILLTLVLSIHVVLEGLTIGSSQDVQTIKSTFIAVASHKGFASFSLGSSLVASGYWEGNRTMFFVLASIFVGVDILSIGIGMGLGDVFEQNGDLVGAILQSLLGGSFLFVATIELIPGTLLEGGIDSFG